MKRQYRELIKEINAGNNLEIVLPKFAKSLKGIFAEYSALQLAFEYYSLKEIVNENVSAYEDAKEVMELFHQVIESVFVKEASYDLYDEFVSKIATCRNQVIEKMDVLTMYADKLQIYEYVLNRKELEFVDSYDPIDETMFKQQLIQYIFGTKDNYVVNERIKEAIGQLPIRLLKAKYYEYVKESLNIYKDADKSALDSYLYMLRTSAMLYQPNKEELYYQSLKELVNELRETSFDTMKAEEYQLLCAKILDASVFISQMTDCYVAIQKVLNALYVYLLHTREEEMGKDGSIRTCQQCIRLIFESFDASESNLENVEVLFDTLVGCQEVLAEEYEMLSPLIPTIMENYLQVLENLSLTEQFRKFIISDKLGSASIFISIEKDEDSFAVTNEYLTYQTNQLLDDLVTLFKGNPQCVNRAIMANTLSKMPVFFNNSQEVVDYITSSLELCKNNEEKTVSMKLLLECIEEALSWKE